MQILQIAVRSGASDIHLKVGNAPTFRVEQRLIPQPNARALTSEDTSTLLKNIVSQKQLSEFSKRCSLDFTYNVPHLGRFRVSAFLQKSTISLAIRVIPIKIKTISELLLPPVISSLADLNRGLILVSGATGVGKSTTLSAMLSHINETRSGHILTIEDPIEFLIRDQNCLVSQREIGTDAPSFDEALRSALRQDPDIIFIGEIRDPETANIALHAAETGHFVLSTMHTTDAPETINHILSMFPSDRQDFYRIRLANVLRGVISQRLIQRSTGRGRVPAVEVMVVTRQIQDYISSGASKHEILEAIASGHTQWGSQSFDQSLVSLVKYGYISYDDALQQASNRADFSLLFSGIDAGAELEPGYQ